MHGSAKIQLYLITVVGHTFFAAHFTIVLGLSESDRSNVHRVYDALKLFGTFVYQPDLAVLFICNHCGSSQDKAKNSWQPPLKVCLCSACPILVCR